MVSVSFNDATMKILTADAARLMDRRFEADKSLARIVLNECSVDIMPSRLFVGGGQHIECSVAAGAPSGLVVVDVNIDNYRNVLSELRSGTEYRFAPGFYDLEKPLMLPSSVRVTGAPSGRTIFRPLHHQTVVAIEEAKDVAVIAVSLLGSDCSALRVQRGSNILLSGIFVDSPSGYGMQIDDDCDSVSIIKCHIRSSGYGGIMARGLINNLLIAENIIDSAYRRELEVSNYGAAIRVQALEHLRKEYDTSITISGSRPSNNSLIFNGVFSHYIGPRRPRNVAIVNNSVINSRSQGVYLSGATLAYVYKNTIAHCDKEAICVDHQSLMNIISNNLIINVGQRDRQTSEELINDHIDLGENKDRFVKAKLPAISVDYSDLNLLIGNSVIGNSGGGIKAVRLACFNLIGLNLLKGNNAGDNDAHVFPEMLIGDASVEGTLKKAYRHSFDNRDYGSSANALVANKIESSKRGIQINMKSNDNFIFRNQLFGCREFDFRVLNDHTYTAGADGAFRRLTPGSWPPSREQIM
jgi:hypothetical protein